MNELSLLALIHNAALLLAIAVLFDLTVRQGAARRTMVWSALLGLLLGTVGIALMLTPWVYAPGVIFDTRSVLLSISGLFFGPLPTAIAMAMLAAFRLYQGGAAVGMGISVILTSGTIGIFWQRLRRRPLETLRGRELYLFGIVIHLVMLGCALILPWGTARQVLANISLPVMTIYPMGTLLLGLLIVHRLRRERIADDLRRAELRMRSLVEILQRPVQSVQEFLDFALDEALRLTGSQFGYISHYAEEQQQFSLAALSQGAKAECTIPNPRTCYHLADIGVWGEVVRQRRAVIINNYLNTHLPKKGYPPGHIRIQNYLSVPVISNESIVAIIGVANKETAYDESDVLQLALLMAGVWKATERKQAEEALRQSEERYKAIIHNLPSGLIHIFDRDFRYVFNAGEGLLDVGLTNETLVGKTIFDVLGPELGDKVAAHYHRVLGGETVRFEGDYQGQEFAVHATPLRDGQGEVTQILALSINITERKRSEERLRTAQAELQQLLKEAAQSRQALLSVVEDQKQAEENIRRLNAELEQRVATRTAELRQANADLAQVMRGKDEFVASMSHELRTPLTGILGLSETLEMGIYGALTDKQAHAVHTVRESGEHLLGLINDVLDLAKVESGKLTLDLGPVAVKDICQASLRLVYGQANQKQIKTQLQVEPVVTRLWADERRLKQMLVNLLSNAIKFTPAGGQVGLDVVGDEAHEEVRFTVWDTGIGINAENLSRLFQPFVQVDNALTRASSGSGLGLALVRRMAELHGGRVAADSEGIPGRGSRFTIVLQWKQSGQTPEPALSWNEPAPALIEPVAHGQSVLIADDVEAIRTVLDGFLTQLGCHVSQARDGVEAWTMLRDLKPTLAFLDIQMPGLDGLEVMRRARADLVLADIPIIAMTALSMPGDRERCLAAGANDYLSKPINRSQLVDLVKHWLAPQSG